MSWRQKFIHGTLMVCLALYLVSCGDSTPDASIADLEAHRGHTPEENLALPEAPMLRARVERGELPALEDRLPENPMVVQTIDEPGLYGGTWRKFDLQTDFVTMMLINNYFPLTRWSPDASGITPGLAESWSYSDDGSEITFNLRRGVHWSDGEPFTSDDILLWWELCLDERHPARPPDWAYLDGQLMEVSAPDDYTVVFTYPGPFYFVDLIVATGFWWPMEMMLPRHYLDQFHPDHSDYTDFGEFDRRKQLPTNPDRPTLGPWRLIEYSPTGDQAVYERNPYYYAVDQNGRQLPYIDRIEVIRVQSPESGVLYVMAGEVDAQFRQIEFKDYALLRRFAEDNDYRVMAWEEGTAAWHALFVNWSPVDRGTKEPDQKRRTLFRDPAFRRGLSVAINRDMINQVVWNGLSRPQSAAITDESWHFDSERGQDVLKRWTEGWSQFDADLANELLDQAGLTERDAEGYRMFNGERFEVMLEYYDEPYASDQALLIEADWERVGVRTLARQAVAADLDNRRREGMYDIYMRHNSELDLFTFPSYVFPVYPEHWHPMVGRWASTGGKEGEAPEGFMAELIDLYEQCKREPDLQKRHQLVLDAIEIQIEHGPFMIGTTGRQRSLIVVNNHLRNIPDSAIMGPWAQCQPGASFPEQMYFDAERLYAEEEK